MDRATKLDSHLPAVDRDTGKCAPGHFDAFLSENIANPGLLEVREIAEFPALSLGETSIGVMRTMGERFGLITINEKYRPRLEDVIRH